MVFFFNVNELQVFSFLSWMKRIRMLSGKFSKLRAKHIYKAYNQNADLLPKATLELEEESIFYTVGLVGAAEYFEILS